MPNRQQRQLSSKVVEFPENFQQRLQSALADQAKGNCSGALKKLIELIDDSCAEANAYVGVLYEVGCSDIEKDYEKARFYYERAVEQHGSLEAYLGLGRIYYFGRGVRADFGKAYQYYELITKEAKDSGIAYLMLGQMYQQGKFVSKDTQKAKECFNKAWQQGYLYGLTYLGLLEQEEGSYLKGWVYRVKAGVIGLKASIVGSREKWRFRAY